MAKKKTGTEMPGPRPHGVICYWEYIPPDESKPGWRIDKKWKLKESFPIDMDGYPMAETSTDGYSDSRHQWMGWLFTDKPDEDGYDDDRTEIMGRAVTLWTVEHGVRLMALHPPEWQPWLSVSFTEELKKLPNWYVLLESGYDLIMGTARAAEEIIFNWKDK